MVAASQERPITETLFGAITTKRVKYRAKKSLFSGVSEVDIPIRHVTSVRYETTRHPIWGVIFAIVGLFFVFASSGSIDGIGIGIAALILAAALLLGWPKVIVTTAGDSLPSVSFPWNKGQAQQFVSALRNQLFENRD